MPELAEVEYYRKVWNPGLGERIVRVRLHPKARIFRDVDPSAVVDGLEGQTFLRSEAQAKQMLFVFSGASWLGLHLGMSGKLLVQPKEFVPDRHDHFVLYTPQRALVFSDYRMFGKVEWSQSKAVPVWWASLPPPILSNEFTRVAVGQFLQRRARSPIKAVLLMQERFPGIGNWMADEILWRARIHPATPAGAVQGRQLSKLFQKILEVTEDAMRVIGEDWSDPPESWLFPHRWREGGFCPKTGKPLQRETIGGRTTCFSPQWQKWKG